MIIFFDALLTKQLLKQMIVSQTTCILQIWCRLLMWKLKLLSVVLTCVNLQLGTKRIKRKSRKLCCHSIIVLGINLASFFYKKIGLSNHIWFLQFQSGTNFALPTPGHMQNINQSSHFVKTPHGSHTLVKWIRVFSLFHGVFINESLNQM